MTDTPPNSVWQRGPLAVYSGDCVTVMQSWPDECVDLVVTSPPYFVGKEYETGWTWEEYCELMRGVYREVARLLRPGRYLVINFGDLHNSGGRMYPAEVPSVYPAALPHFEWGREVGLDLQAARIWRKHFARVAMGHVVNTRPRNAFDFEHLWTWRKAGQEGEEWCNDRRLSQRGVVGEDWGTPARLDRHCAAFPVELPTWAIKVYSRQRGETVLDPFGGSMTTLIAAHTTGRRGWAIELSPDYLEVGLRRLAGETAQMMLLDDEGD